MEINEQIAKLKIVPVIALNKVESAAPLAEALVKGGLPVAEVTFRTDAAEDSIKTIAKAYPQILVGAGTVTNTEQAKRALNAGAKFIVTPGFSRAVAEFCIDNKLPLFPGACTPTEIMMLLEYSLSVAKFFPAGQFGGLATIKSLAAPFPQMKFMPTGGVSEKNILEYLAFDKIIACGGSWMVDGKLINSGNFAEIEKLVSSAVKLVQQ